MAYPDIPAGPKASMAQVAMRLQHDNWHLVRSQSEWNKLPPSDRAALVAAGWQAPRFEQEPMAGVDFLGMHRAMIEEFNHLLGMAGDPKWPSVTAWSPFPWADNDPDWPVPPWPGIPPDFAEQREPATVQQMKQIAAAIASPAYLKSRTIDRMGTDIEFSLHGWMHLRWSAEPVADLASEDVANDWLGAPFSSHVNKHFWKLHGWIDDRIRDWEIANDKTADLSEAWSGPGHVMHDVPMDAMPPLTISRSRGGAVFRIDAALVEQILAARD